MKNIIAIRNHVNGEENFFFIDLDKLDDNLFIDRSYKYLIGLARVSKEYDMQNIFHNSNDFEEIQKLLPRIKIDPPFIGQVIDFITLWWEDS